MIDSKTKSLLDGAISKHLAACGSKDWGAVRGQFSDVPDPTFWRMVKKVKARAAAKAGIERINVQVSTAAGTNTMPADSAPTQPQNAPEGGFCIDLMAQFRGLFADVDLLRNSAINADGEITDSQMLAKSAALRESVLRSAVQTLHSLWDLGRMDDLYAEIVKGIGEVSPDTQLAIMQRLQKLNESRGYS